MTDFCVRNINQAAYGRKEIDIAEQGKRLEEKEEKKRDENSVAEKERL